MLTKGIHAQKMKIVREGIGEHRTERITSIKNMGAEAAACACL